MPKPTGRVPNLYPLRVSATERIQADIAAAMRARDRQRTGALRLVLSNLQLAAKEAGGDGLDDAAEAKVLRTERKRRLEAAEAFREGGRREQAETEEREAELIETYMPAELSDDELGRLVAEAIAETGASSPGEMGKVMGAVMPRVAGRADGKRVGALVREKLLA